MRLKGTFSLVFCIVTLIISCRSRKISVTEPATTVSKSPVNNAEYSRKLGIPVPATANPNLIKSVSEWMGVPYKFGGNDRRGLDCSGLVNQIYPSVYQLNVPRVAADIYAKAKTVPKKNLQEGDLVFFKINTSKVGHVGIFLFDEYFVHASTSRGVIISRLTESYWSKYYVGAGRLLP